MTTNWNGGNGKWQVAANWSNGAPTTPTSDAIIDASGAYTVTIDSGHEYRVGTVSLDSAGATLSIAGTLDLKNKLTVSAGTLALSGTIHGGTVSSAGGTVQFDNATLDDINYGGVLDLTQPGAAVTVKDGLTLSGVDGIGLGAVKLASGGEITFAGSQQIDNGTFTITGGTVNVAGGALTLGPSLSVAYQSKTNVFSAGASIINEGVFHLNASNLSITGAFSNTGVVSLENGNFSAASFTNAAAGEILLTGKSVFEAGATGGFDNAGLIKVGVGGTLQLSSFINTGTIDGEQATINITDPTESFGTFNLNTCFIDVENVKKYSDVFLLMNKFGAGGQGNILTIGIDIKNSGNLVIFPGEYTGYSFGKLTIHGKINGGLVTSATNHGEAGTATAFSGELENLTYQGPLNVVGTLILDDVTFTAGGLINLGGTLNVLGGTPNASIDNADIVLVKGGRITATGQSLIFGANLTIDAETAFQNFKAGRKGLQTLVNNGLIQAEGPGASGRTFDLIAKNITNNGTILVNDYCLFRIDAGSSFTNVSGSTLTGGTYEIYAHSALLVGNDTLSITTLQADVILHGLGTKFLSNGLATIGSQGELSLQNGSKLKVAQKFTVDGILNLANSTLAAGQMTIDVGGVFSGYGKFLGAIINDGTIDASQSGFFVSPTADILSISQNVTGAGAAEIESGSTLSFGGSVAAGQAVTFEGLDSTLSLRAAKSFAGTIAGFTAGNGNTIDLIETAGTAVAYNATNGTLKVENGGTVVATLKLIGDYTGDTFSLGTDGSGGTTVTVAESTPAVHRFIEAVAAFSPSNMAATGLSAAPSGNQFAPVVAANHAHFV